MLFGAGSGGSQVLDLFEEALNAVAVREWSEGWVSMRAAST
jgi:hypothetical protein